VNVLAKGPVIKSKQDGIHFILSSSIYLIRQLFLYDNISIKVC
jgi:hypothetical protein